MNKTDAFVLYKAKTHMKNASNKLTLRYLMGCINAKGVLKNSEKVAFHLLIQKCLHSITDDIKCL